MSRDSWIRRGEHFPSGSPKSWMSQLYLGVNTACVSSGSPLPDGTPTQRGYVLLLAPYDSPTDILKARFQAAGGDPSHVQLVLPFVGDPSRDLAYTRPCAFPLDLAHLVAIIRSLDFCLVILDPASGIPGLSRCLPALVELARQTNCAILLTRSLRQSPVDPFHAPAPTSPLLQAARSRLLLAPDPTGDGHQLLLTTKHALCTQPVTLAYDIHTSEAGIPTIHWLGQRDHGQLSRLCTGPIRSPYRQAILRFLQHSDTPQSIPDVLEATSYDREAGRKMLVRMKMAGELVSPARGLYTTAHHPCLLHFTDQTPSVPNVPSAPSSQNTPLANSSQSDVPNVSNVPSSQNTPLANSQQSDEPAVPATDPTPSRISPVS